jgi:hyperosmotically inducible periplasmic protein
MKLYPTFAVPLISLVSVVGCDSPSTPGTTSTTSALVDTTRFHAEDRNGAPTAMSQGNDSADLQTTQAIRKAIMADESLSMAAKNITIVTRTGDVTLRGSVRTISEERDIVAKAEAMAGPHHVDDMMQLPAAK